MNYKKCTTVVNDSKVVVKEHRSSFELRNTARLKIEKIRVDDCLINDARERCDWLLVNREEKKRVLYVELKGADIGKAIRQLEATLGYTKTDFSQCKRECYVVSTRVPKHGPAVHKRMIDFQKKTKHHEAPPEDS
ncbi:MAG: hypothetical protein D3922_03585, partial [Candidatus Electrothrix sp. AR1]|nr:hypothetical protein [Candidatus Electrothrix sp. AR1]